MQYSWMTLLFIEMQLFDCLRDACLTINLVRCEFAKATVIHHGKVAGQLICPREKKNVFWPASCLQAFDNIKSVLCSSLAALGMDKPFNSHMASDVGAGSVLFQTGDMIMIMVLIAL